MVNHGFQFTLKYLILRGLIIDHLWFDKTLRLKYLDDLFHHLDIINESNFGKYSVEASGNHPTDAPLSSKISITVSDCFPRDVDKVIFLAYDPILLDPDVLSCLDSTSLYSELVCCEKGSVQNHEFAPYLRKNLKAKICAIKNFELPTFNSFDCLSSNPIKDNILECSDRGLVDVTDQFVNKHQKIDCYSPEVNWNDAHSSDNCHLSFLKLDWLKPDVLITAASSGCDDSSCADSMFDFQSPEKRSDFETFQEALISESFVKPDYICMCSPSSPPDNFLLDWLEVSDSSEVEHESEAVIF